MDWVWAAEKPRDPPVLARRRLDAVLAACRPAREPGSPEAQAQLSQMLLELVAALRHDPDIVIDVATILADAPWAPEGACLELARQAMTSAATADAAANETVVIRLLARGSAAFRREIARDAALPPEVAVVMAQDRDETVVAALLDNPGVALQAGTIDALVARALREPALRSALARHPALDADQAFRLASVCSANGRRRLAARFGPVATERSEGDEADRGDEVEWLRKLEARGELLPSTLLTMLRRGCSGGFREGLRRLGASAADRAPDARALRDAGIDRAAMAAFGEALAAPAAGKLETRR